MNLVKTKIYRGVFGHLYKVSNARVLISSDEGDSWHLSSYGKGIKFFEDGIRRGYFKEVK